MTKFRPYFYYLTFRYDEQNNIVSDKIKFFLDESEQWKDQLNSVTTNEFAKQQFWIKVNEHRSSIEKFNATGEF